MSKKADKRRADAAAAKQRRQKVIAFGGLGVLAILMMIQGPKLLDQLGGSETPAPVAAPVVAPPVETSSDEPSRRTLRFNGSGSDPFAARSISNNDPASVSFDTPAGARDPFQRGGGSSPDGSSPPVATPKPAPQLLPKQIVIGTPTPGAVGKRGWIVVLASIQTRVGRAYADRFARRVRSDGLGTVSVLNSSNRRPLRSGYWVVYTGPFATLSQVQRSASHVRAFGYRTAYVREILRY